MARRLNIAPRPNTGGSGLIFDGIQNYINLGTMGDFGSNWGSGFYMRFSIQVKPNVQNKVGFGNEATNKTSFSITFNCEQNFQTANGKIMIRFNDQNNHILIAATENACDFNDGALHDLIFSVNFATRVVTITMDGTALSVLYSNRDTLNTFTNFSGNAGNMFIMARQSSGNPSAFVKARLLGFKIGTSASNLYGDYNFAEGTGTEATDASGQGNTATLLGSPVPKWNVRESIVRTPIVRTATPPIERVNPIAVAQNNLQNYTLGQLNTIFTLMQAGGIRRIRTQFIMGDIQATEGVYDWTDYDRFVDLALTYDIEIIGLIIQYGMPNWAKTDPEEQNGHPTPEVFADWCEDLAVHYDGKIYLWEPLNEPNFDIYWPPSPNAVESMALANAAYDRIKSVNPDAVIIGTAPGNKFSTDGDGIATTTFLQSQYDNGLKAHSDVQAFHPYTVAVFDGTTTTNFSNLNALRAIMIANGDRNKHVMLTEIGWSTYTGGPTETQQANNVKEFLNKSMNSQDYDYIDIISFYNFIDAGSNAADPEHNYGIVETTLTPKPSYQSFIEMRKLYNGIFTELNYG